MSEFDMKWRHWRDDCERRLEVGQFAAVSNLETIARVGSANFLCVFINLTVLFLSKIMLHFYNYSFTITLLTYIVTFSSSLNLK